MQQLGFNMSTYLPTYLSLPICIPEVLDVRVYLNLSSPPHRPLEVYGARIYLRELRDKCSCLLDQQLLLLLLVSIIIIIVVAIAGGCRFKHIALALTGTTGIYYCLHIIRSLRTEELHHHRSLRSIIPLILLPMSYIIEIIIVVRRCE